MTGRTRLSTRRLHVWLMWTSSRSGLRTFPATSARNMAARLADSWSSCAAAEIAIDARHATANQRRLGMELPLQFLEQFQTVVQFVGVVRVANIVPLRDVLRIERSPSGDHLFDPRFSIRQLVSRVNHFGLLRVVLLE